jgi:hypothetical protein
MQLTEEDKSALLKMEKEFLTPEFRANPEAAAEIFDEDFVEFGQSGRRYDKAGIIADLRAESFKGIRTISQFAARPLAPGLVLVTYVITVQALGADRTSQSLRSSIWRKSQGQWQIVFHQGTPTKGR